MKVAIIDADLIGRQKHRFPNLVCEKLSAFWKEKGAVVELKLDYEGLDQYDDVYICSYLKNGHRYDVCFKGYSINEITEIIMN